VTPTVADRLVRLLDHLGLPRAHVCGRHPLDVADLLASAPERVASVVLQGASGRPEPFAPLGARALWLLGDAGATGPMRPQLERTPNTVRWLGGYPEFLWSDTAGDRADEVAGTLLDFLGTVDAAAGVPAVALSGAGEAAGVAYAAGGRGSPVLLLPLGLSPRQWEPILARLQSRHCTIVLGGEHLQPVAILEGRAQAGYLRVALDLLELANPRRGDGVLEVGCGSGALLRRIAGHPAGLRVTGLDVNAFLLREARALAARAGLGGRITFDEGSAEALPYADDAFDVVYSCTVMEEVDADRMLAEMVRVAKPGGRVAVGVRAVDRPQWTNLPLPPALKEKLERPLDGAGVGARGCADESLYRRFGRAGLTAVSGGPTWGWARPEDRWWQGGLAHLIRNALTPEEHDAWSVALAQARADGLPVWLARPFHCAVGTKPAA
jgi:SAM-dependent methyltransferase